MESPTSEAPFGALAPNLFDRAVMALTVRLPDNWAGLKLATGLRRLVTMRMDTAGALDVTRWRLRMRLHPRDNGCEKNLLFTPQMYEPPEREELAREIADVGGRAFVFVDVGANVGLFSLYVAATAPAARILAIEPEPGNFARLAFNIAANPGVPIVPLSLALGDAEGTAEIVLNARDRGGTRLAANGTQGRGVAVQCRPLLAVVTEAGVDRYRRAQDRRRGRRGQSVDAVLPRCAAVAVAAPRGDRGFQRRVVDRPVRAPEGEGLRGLLAQQAERDAAAGPVGRNRFIAPLGGAMRFAYCALRLFIVNHSTIGTARSSAMPSADIVQR